jgi:response regulator RpfG family c-di-GMP phosphodiesterase
MGEQPPDDTPADTPKSPENPATDSILCVDDDPNILEAFQRQFRKKFNLHTAIGPEPGLEALANSGPFAVVVSDLRMPGMDGIQFLAAVRDRSPETIRIMLTGQADLSTSIAAVNQGSIFRFLVKPCAPTVLGKVLEAGLAQHQLMVAERQLTQQTLLGCVEVLVEVLSIAQPEAFNQAKRVRRYVQRLASILSVAETWQFETAAMLSQIGLITLPRDLAEKASARKPLTLDETSRFAGHAAAASRILEKVPRLETVAKIISAQQEPWRNLRHYETDERNKTWTTGAQMLKAAMDYDDLRYQGCSYEDASLQMNSRGDIYGPEMLQALARLAEIESAEEIRSVPVLSLAPNMVLEENIDVQNGLCLLGAGQEITSTILERLHSFSHLIGPDQTVKVRIRGDPGRK